MTTLNKEVKAAVLALIVSTDFDYSRIILADHDFTNGEITLLLEDKNDFKNTIDECVCVIVPANDFAAFIDKGNYNKYEGRNQRRGGSVYDGLVTIDEPLNWYDNDATSFQQGVVREDLIKAIIKLAVAE